jgi:two-component system, OmpR family, KDP operon response regulator KdpE
MLIDTPETLIISAESEFRHALVQLFKTSGHRTSAALSVVQAIRNPRICPDLVLFDLKISTTEDDWLAVSEVRRRFADTTIIAISCRRDIHAKVAALDAGADDFLAKPLDPEELCAHVRARLRRRDGKPAQTSPSNRIGGFEFDLEKSAVKIDGRIVSLSRKEFDLLQLFARYEGKVLTPRFLLSQMWDELIDTQYIRVYVSQLRGKIETDPTRPR